MTNYNLKPQDPTTPAWQEAKEKRKKQLTAVRNRRRLILCINISLVRLPIV